MKTTYKTFVIGQGNHASIEIPEKNLAELGANKRAPLKITVNNYTYQSTATGVDGKCVVVFPMRDREVSGASAGDYITVTLELDDGYRQVDIPQQLKDALSTAGLTESFNVLNYSKRKEFSRLVQDAKTNDTAVRRIEKILTSIKTDT